MSERELEIDGLLAAFQRACENCVVEGDSDLNRTMKERAVIRNDLRSRLLVATAPAPSSRAEDETP